MVAWKILSWTLLFGIKLVKADEMFSSTCNAVSLTSNGVLTANCAKTDESRVDSQLDLGLCYANRHGKLSPAKK